MISDTILFFDSGVGGLTTLCQCLKFCPNHHYVYYADVDNMPYGRRPRKDLQTLIKNKISQLIVRFSPCIVVLACNTATSVGISELRAKYPKIIFIGTEPAVIPAIKIKKRILLMATHNTIRFSKIVNLVDNYYPLVKVCPQRLASLIERNFDNVGLLNKYLTRLLRPFKDKVDCVVLGCTHYVFCKSMIQDIMGKDVLVLDGNVGIAQRLSYCLNLFNINNSTQTIEFCNTAIDQQHVLRAFGYLNNGGNVCAG